jgi:hypothetical protein
VVGDELHQAAVGIAEVDAGPTAVRAVARRRSGLDLDAVRGEVVDRLGDRSVPRKAQIAVARRDGDPGDGIGVDARRVDVELLGPEAIGPAGIPES